MKSSVITEVVRHDQCVGCGLCAALCPQEALEISWNQNGEYSPNEVVPCTTECGLCLKICPFADNKENEDTIGKELYGRVPGNRHRPEIGYYLASYVGYAEKYRLRSASGGVVTWLLEKLLTEDVVDHVICVAPTGNPERLFSFTIFDTPEGMRIGAGSAYYPVEMSGVIKQVIDAPGRYAITGLPCFIKAIRLAQKKNIILRERIMVTVGLVCGQLKSRHFTDYIATFAEVPGKVIRVCYRGKSPDHPASNFYFAFKTENNEERKIFWSEGIAEAWNNRWFTPNACNYCDDIFAECADVTCMDAWLPMYLNESRGTSFMLVRSPLVREMVEQGDGIRLKSIPVERLVQSQLGVVTVKRQYLAYRLYLDQKSGYKVPMKRVAPNIPKNPLLRHEIVLKEKMRVMSKDFWNSNISNAGRLREVMQPPLRQLAAERQIMRIISFPVKGFRYVCKKDREKSS